jgi:hypothetical protein
VAEPIQEGILREIDEELRQDQFTKLWKRYGKILIGIAIVIISSVAGYKAWQSYDVTYRGQQGERFSATIRLVGEGNREIALDALTAFQADASQGYQMLAGFQAAALMADGEDGQGAAAAYDKLANDNSLDIIYRDLAILLGTIQRMNSDGDKTSLITDLESLAADNNPWRYSARELIAVLAKQSGDKSKARELFTALTDDATTPQGIRLRAKELLAGLAE